MFRLASGINDPETGSSESYEEAALSQTHQWLVPYQRDEVRIPYVTPGGNRATHHTADSSSCTQTSLSEVLPDGAERGGLDQSETSGLELAHLISALKNISSGVTNGTPPPYGDFSRTSPTRPRDGTYPKQRVLFADPECEMDAPPVPYQPVSDHSAHYSSPTMQTLSCMEGISLSKAPPYRRHAAAGAAAEEGPAGGSPDLHEKGKLWYLNKQKWIGVEKARQAMLEEAEIEEHCSFTPKLSEYAEHLQRPAALRPERRARDEVLYRKLWLAQKQKEQLSEDLRDCTFHPVTLTKSREKQRRSPRVFDALFAEAQHRHCFATEVRASVVKEAEQALHGGGGPVVSPDRVEEIVQRLFSKAAQVSPETAAAGAGTPSPHVPQLSEKTREIIREQRESGERVEDPTDRLYAPCDPHSAARVMQQLMDEEVGSDHQQPQRPNETAAAKRRQKKLEAQLQRQRWAGLLASKYRFLVRTIIEGDGAKPAPEHTAAAGAGKASWRSTSRFAAQCKVSAADLMRAAACVLTEEESTELLTALERLQKHEVREEDFVQAVLRHTEGEPSHPLLTTELPPPPPSPQHHVRVKRAPVDPAVIAERKEKRQQHLKNLREEAVRRQLGGGSKPEATEFRSREVPRYCKPDVQRDVKKTRSSELRRAHASHKITELLIKQIDFSEMPVESPGARQRTTLEEWELTPRGLPPASEEDHLPFHDSHSDAAYAIRRSELWKPEVNTPARVKAPSRLSSEPSAEAAGNLPHSIHDEEALLEMGKEALIRQLRQYHHGT